MIQLFLLGLGAMIILSIIDFLTYNKERGFIPSILTTTFLILAFVVAFESNPLLTIQLGVFGGLLALAFTDLDMWGGIADFKIFIACSMLVSSLNAFLVFALALSIVSLLVKGILSYKLKHGKQDKFPFIPLILIAYLLAGGVA
jgi:hypothetical protein